MFYKEFDVLTEEEIDAFTKGDCAFLAEAIVETRPDDFTMFIITDVTGDDSIESSFYHMVAEHIETGLFLDAEGVWDYDALEEHYAEVALGEMFGEEYSMSLYFDQGGYGRAYSEDPQHAADMLLAAFDEFLETHQQEA